jgi:hypothetical protein
MLTDRQRRNIEAMRREGRAAGEVEETAAELLPARRLDMVGCWPSDRLHELIAQRPDLLPELQRRRPGECEQL